MNRTGATKSDLMMPAILAVRESTNPVCGSVIAGLMQRISTESMIDFPSVPLSVAELIQKVCPSLNAAVI